MPRGSVETHGTHAYSCSIRISSLVTGYKHGWRLRCHDQSFSSYRDDVSKCSSLRRMVAVRAGKNERVTIASLNPAPHLLQIKVPWTIWMGRFISAVAAALVAISPMSASAVTTEQLVFLDAWRAVDRAYVDKGFNGQNWFKVREKALKNEKMDNREETYAAIKRLLASLDDPFTRFLEPDQYSALRRSTSGSVTGIGVEASFATERGSESPLIVLSPAPGGPADRAGIAPGDEILEIDGKPTSELSLYAAGNLLQGPEGSSVTLRVRSHSGSKAIKNMNLTREIISLNPVDEGLCQFVKSNESNTGLKKKMGYIRVATFNKQTSLKFREALDELKGQGMESLVLDIRNNGGGLFPAGIEVARMLIDEGNIVLIADADGIRDEYEATGTAVDSITPLTVLVNKGTASASEVLAGAIKDSKRGRIVGENTFGKGLIQTLVELSDGSAVTITVSKYQTPSGIDINKIGIEPDQKLTNENLSEIPFGAKKFCKFAETSNIIVLE